eukprot:7972401-Alexandrium_andersonii.AAC.1
MSASLVGSEMCIRDRTRTRSRCARAPPGSGRAAPARRPPTGTRAGGPRCRPGSAGGSASAGPRAPPPRTAAGAC